MGYMQKKDHIYEVVVVGAGLSGLIVAASLIKKGVNVCLLESTEFSGGHSRLVYSPLGLVDNGIKFFPDTEGALQALNWLNQLLPHPIEFGAVENGPVTYHNGELKPFVGFGKDAPDFHDQLSYFLEPRRLELSRKLGQIVADLGGLVTERFYPESTVTKYVGVDGEITSVMVNGQKLIHGKRWVHATSPKYLAQVLSEEVLSSRTKQRLAKANYWTTIGLDVFHQGIISERGELHLLNGTTQDELGPCVGLFHPSVVDDKSGEYIQHSQWSTFVDYDSGEDPEVVGAALKKIRRQIKRAYPNAFEKLASERIFVAPLTEAELDLKSENSGLFPGVENLWLAHGSASQELNLTGAINQAFRVASHILGDTLVESPLVSPKK